MYRRVFGIIKIIIMSILTILWDPIADSKSFVINLGSGINSKFDDFAPSLTADGKIMVFNSKRYSSYQDIFIAYNKNGKWTTPVPINEINSSYNDETPFIASDGSMIVFASDRDGSIEMPRDAHGKIRISFDLYYSKISDGKWSAPLKIPGEVNTIHHERSPSIGADGVTLYYTSWPFGDLKKSQIMKAVLKGNSFLNPEPLPYPINTGNQEIAFNPAIDKEGFYFSSARKGGYGGWDIYYVSYEGGKYGTPVNMGPNINSPYNEMYYVKTMMGVYFCSNRPGGLGRHDIYWIAVEPDTKKDEELKIVVIDKKTRKPVQTEMKISAKVVDSKGSSSEYRIIKKTDKEGESILKYNKQIDEIEISVNEKGYLPYIGGVDVDKLKGKKQIIELTPIEKESSFNVHAIYFDYDSAKLRKESYKYLDTITEYMLKNTKVKFLIIGHTDLKGSAKYNMNLSLKRAKAVKEYLVSKGIENNRLKVMGAGESKPLINKSGPGYDEKNRRTEFKFLDE